MQVPGISEQSVGTPVDDLKPRQEAETETQSQESAHLEELLFSYHHCNDQYAVFHSTWEM